MTVLKRSELNSLPDVEEFRRRGFWKGKLLVDYFDERCSENPDKTALIDSRGSLTYGEVYARTRCLAMSFARLGIGAGDVVAVQAPNWSELIISHLALDRIGTIFLPLHDGFRHQEMHHILSKSHAKALIFPASYHGFEHRELVDKLRSELPELRHVVVMRSEAREGELAFETLATEECFEEQKGKSLLADRRPDPSEPLQVMVSSGTTSLPQCSVFCDNAQAFKIRDHFGSYACHLGPDDIAAAIAPAGTGATGYSYAMLAPLLHGGTSVLLERWSGNASAEALDLITKYRCTYAVVIPTQLVKLVNTPGIDDYDFSSLRFITNAGAKLAPSVAEAAERLFGCVVQTIYGATDAGVPTMTTIDDPANKRRTVGRVLEGQDLMIVDDKGHPVGEEIPGEIWWRGANAGFGYLNSPEATKAIWDDDGWYHSGDIGVMDGDGYLSIVGRKKDMIIRGGRNISPGKIEEILLLHSKVMDVAVIPVLQEELGEIACAVVIPNPKMDKPTLAELNEFLLAEEYAVWLQPERLELVDDFPRNVGGKVDKSKLAVAVKARPSATGNAL